MSDTLYLAIDQGGHASRALVVDGKGKTVAYGESPIKTYTPQNDWVEHDANELVTSVVQAVSDAVKQVDHRQPIAAAGLATQRSSIVCWDKVTGRPLSPVISWQDRRQATWLQQFVENNDVIHSKTGLFLSPHYGASKLRWCLDNLPDVKQAQQQQRLCMGPIASYLAARLVGIPAEAFADPANASRTLLWNLQGNHWDEELCKLFGVNENILPRCSTSQETFGMINLADRSIPLTIMTGDQPAALFAGGQPHADTLYINIGTGAFIQRVTHKSVAHDTLLSGIAYLDNKHSTYTLEGTVNGAARALQWFKQHYSVHDLEKKLPQWLEQPLDPPLFINGVSGLGSPYWVANLESKFIGEGDIEAKGIAIVESIVFLIYRNIEEMRQTLPEPKQIIVSGGLAQLDGLCQRLANLAQRIVIRPKAIEATAQGLAFLVAGQPSTWPQSETAKAFTPAPHPALIQRYQSWQRHMECSF